MKDGSIWGALKRWDGRVTDEDVRGGGPGKWRSGRVPMVDWEYGITIWMSDVEAVVVRACET